MGLSNKTNEFKFINITNDDADDQRFFGLMDKKGDDWIVIDKFRNFDGNLLDIASGSYNYEKGKKTITQPKVTLTFNSNDQSYKIDMNYNYLTRSVLNSLCSIESFGGREVSLTLDRKGDFDKCYVNLDGEKTSWKYANSDLPLQDGKRNTQFNDAITDMIKEVKSNLKEVESAPPPTEEPTFLSEADEEENWDLD